MAHSGPSSSPRASVDAELRQALEPPPAVRRRIVRDALAARPSAPGRSVDWVVATVALVVAALAIAIAWRVPGSEAPSMRVSEVTVPTLTNAGGGGVRLLLPVEEAAPAVPDPRPIPQIVSEAGVVAVVDTFARSPRRGPGEDG